jgi:hypothetical protein
MLIEKNGTCLDLSLLFAACLEHVGIMPVIFLIEGHSFPGYWRTNEARLRFLTSKGSLCSNESAEKSEPLVEDKTRLDPKLGFGVFGPQSVADIMEALQDGGLVPLETTELTRRGSFAEALDQGTKNLITDWSFNALIDLQTARDKGVTPIPLFDQPTH